MSLSISFIGKFYNGKTRCIGSHVSTNGLNNSKLYMDQDDEMFIATLSSTSAESFKSMPTATAIADLKAMLVVLIAVGNIKIATIIKITTTGDLKKFFAMFLSNILSL